MSEKCPLVYRAWESDRNFPEMCREQCGKLWEEAAETQPGEIDDFTDSIDNTCRHFATEYLDSELSRTDAAGGAGRRYAINSSCMNCGEETDSEYFYFVCPSN